MKIENPCNGCAHRPVCRNAHKMKNAVEALRDVQELQELGESILTVRIDCNYYFPSQPTIRDLRTWDQAITSTITENYGDSH